MTQAGSTLGTAVVTGASSGIGRVYAARLARRGHDLIVVARRQDRLEALAAELTRTYGVSVRPIAADLGARHGLDTVVGVLKSDPAISMLINSAGTATLAAVAATSQAHMEAMVAINVTALSALTMAALAAFKPRNAGTIVNIGSTLGLEALPISSLYSGTKAFVITFTRGLQAELATTALRLQLVLPSATATDIWDTAGVPLSKLNPASVMTTDDLVDAALKGLDMGESVTLPTVADVTLLDDFDAHRLALFRATRGATPAARYDILD